jgi:hypothetical protein
MEQKTKHGISVFSVADQGLVYSVCRSALEFPGQNPSGKHLAGRNVSKGVYKQHNSGQGCSLD